MWLYSYIPQFALFSLVDLYLIFVLFKSFRRYFNIVTNHGNNVLPTRYIGVTYIHIRVFFM